MELFIGIFCVLAFYSIFFLMFYINTRNTIRGLKTTIDEWKFAFEKEKIENQRNLNKVYDLEKKTKLSNDVLAVLSDLKSGGTILHIERLDKNDVYFHQGSNYR